MAGNRTHDHQIRQLEQGETSQDERAGAGAPPAGGVVRHPAEGGHHPTNRETRGQNKHNHGDQQTSHRPQRHPPDQETR